MSVRRSPREAAVYLERAGLELEIRARVQSSSLWKGTSRPSYPSVVGCEELDNLTLTVAEVQTRRAELNMSGIRMTAIIEQECTELRRETPLFALRHLPVVLTLPVFTPLFLSSSSHPSSYLLSISACLSTKSRHVICP